MRRPLFLLIGVLFLSSCDLLKRSGSTREPSPEIAREAKEPRDTTQTYPERSTYNATPSREHDLIHTKLEVRFDWDDRYVLGKASLQLHPYFYPTDSLTLDAKGFDIHKVLLEGDSTLHELSYNYDQKQLHIKLDTTYTRRDTFTVNIDYTAKPEERSIEKGTAIASDQGLYFIDPDSTDPHKPTQIWTQGEPEANSCWFPTIDQPNERMTQEIHVTVPRTFKTLSNGSLVYSLENGNGTRTDLWKQELSHPPYLTMLAIGDYAVVKDKWKDLPARYWVEPSYRDDAMAIFGKTPEMIGFFSDLLDVEYPWAKYDQVIVRDFVSGAMENTSATIHGEFVQKTRRQLIDGGNEPIIAHELFHHWFGNMVTCESWANLPLNEAFATYGEYLWLEHSKGREAADHHLRVSLGQHFRAARRNQKDLIRFNYSNEDAMFDTHSYNKGGGILHMLRKEVGDEAFFASLEHYLTSHAFEPVEVHDLRLAFEEVTGRDLNWFFDQWFLDKGHPRLKIRQHYDTTAQEVVVTVEQNQNLERFPVFRLPIAVDLYYKAFTQRRNITINAARDTFHFNSPHPPKLVNIDAEKMLLAEKDEQKPLSQWVYQYYHAPLYQDRYEAIGHCGNEVDTTAVRVVIDALSDRSWHLQLLAMRKLEIAHQFFPEKVTNKLEGLARKSPVSQVRANALRYLDRYSDKSLSPLFEKAIQDSSYLVTSTALQRVAAQDPAKGLKHSVRLEQANSPRLLTAIAGIYKEHGSSKHLSFFQEAAPRVNALEHRIGFISLYGKFLKDKDTTTIQQGIGLLEELAVNEETWYVKGTAIRAIQDIRDRFWEEASNLEEEQEELQERVAEEKGGNNAEEQVEELEEHILAWEQQARKVEEILDRIKRRSSDPQVQMYLKE